MLADLTTVVATRLKPLQATEAFSGGWRRASVKPVAITQRGSRDGAGALRQRHEGLRHRRAGLRRPQERSVVRGQRREGVAALVSGAAERALDRPPACARTRCCSRIPRCSGPRRGPMRILPAGHQEAWSDAFRNLIADVYALHRRPVEAGLRSRSTQLTAFLPDFRRRVSRRVSRGLDPRQPSPRRSLDRRSRDIGDRNHMMSMTRPSQAVGADVPPVLRVGRLVGHARHLAGTDARLLRRADRARRRDDGAGGDDLAVLRRHGGRSVPRHRAHPGRAARRRRADSAASPRRRHCSAPSTRCSSRTPCATCRRWRSATRCRSAR